MNLSDKERTFVVRGLDNATTPDEADTCARNFFKELRKRGIDGYRFIDQMDYAEYEREIDEESIKSNQAWDKHYRAQAANPSRSAQGNVPPPTPPRETPKDFNSAETATPHKPSQSVSKTLFLSLLSFGLAFLFTHHIFATLLLGGLIAV